MKLGTPKDEAPLALVVLSDAEPAASGALSRERVRQNASPVFVDGDGGVDGRTGEDVERPRRTTRRRVNERSGELVGDDAEGESAVAKGGSEASRGAVSSLAIESESDEVENSAGCRSIRSGGWTPGGYRSSSAMGFLNREEWR